MTEPETAAGPRAHGELRDFLRRVITEADGRAVTTAEIRHHAEQAGFSDQSVVAVYRTLLSMERRGQLGRVDSRGRNVYWASTDSPGGEGVRRRLSTTDHSTASVRGSDTAAESRAPRMREQGASHAEDIGERKQSTTP